MTTDDELPVYLTTGETSLRLGVLLTVLQKAAIASPPPAETGAIKAGRYLLFDPNKLDKVRDWLAGMGIFCSQSSAFTNSGSHEDKRSADRGERDKAAVLQKYRRSRKPELAGAAS